MPRCHACWIAHEINKQFGLLSAKENNTARPRSLLNNPSNHAGGRPWNTASALFASNFSLTSASKKYISSNRASVSVVAARSRGVPFPAPLVNIPPVGVLVASPSPSSMPRVSNAALTLIGDVFAPRLGGAVTFNQCTASVVIAAYPR